MGCRAVHTLSGAIERELMPPFVGRQRPEQGSRSRQTGGVFKACARAAPRTIDRRSVSQARGVVKVVYTGRRLADGAVVLEILGTHIFRR